MSIARFVADRGFRLANHRESDRLLYWYVHALLWGRYSGSTETVLNIDLQRIAEDPTLERLVDELPRHLLGQQTSLELHHVFPKALLKRHGFDRPDRNALANFTFLTLESNRSLREQPPERYLVRCQENHPGVLESHWIPTDPELWRVERYPEFVARRRELLAEAANRFLDELWAGRAAEVAVGPGVLDGGGPPVIVEPDDETVELDAMQQWLTERGLSSGIPAFALMALDGGREEAVLDLAWPDGLRYGDERVALLLNEPAHVLDAAGRHGYRFFTSTSDMQDYVEREVLAVQS